jgi:hypothetical protein
MDHDTARTAWQLRREGRDREARGRGGEDRRGFCQPVEFEEDRALAIELLVDALMNKIRLADRLGDVILPP